MRKLLFLFLWLTPLFLGAAHQPAMWGPFYKQSFTGRNLSTSPLTVGGLKGDTYDYKVILYKKSTADSGITLRCNGDSGSNYRQYILGGAGSTVSPTYSNAETSIVLVCGGTNTSYANASIAEITGKSGGERAASVAYSGTWGASATYIYAGVQFWKNTADELTSLTFFSAQNVSQDFDLIILQKLKVAQDSEWELVERRTLSSTNLSNGVFFSGLDGDSDEEYLLKGCFTASAADASLNMRFNGDSGANYAFEYLRNQNGTASAYNVTTASVIPITVTATSPQPCVFEAKIKAKSGMYRPVFLTCGGGGTYNANGIYMNWWKNTADKLESMNVYIYEAGVTATGYIELYRRGKSVSASKPTFETLKEVDVDGEFSQGHTFDLAGLGIPDADNESMLVLEYSGVSKTAGQANMAIAANFNGDSGNNYYIQSVCAENSTARAFAQSQSYLSYWLCGATYPSFVRFYIFPKSGKYRPVLSEGGINNGSYAYVFCDSAWWLNTADKLRSIKVYAASANQTQFKGKITLKRLAQ